MGIFNLFSKKSPHKNIEIKSATQPLYGSSVILEQDSFLGYAIAGEGRVTPTQAFKWYRSNSALATAVDMIGDSIEQIQPVLKIGDELTDTVEIIDLLRQPNGFETLQEFLGKLSRHYLLTKNAFLLAFGNIVRPPLELYSPKPSLISGIADTDGYARQYNILSGIGRGDYARDTQKIGQMVKFISQNALRELYPIAGFSSRSDDVLADSPLEAAALEVRQQIKGKIHNVKLLENGAHPSILVHFKDEGLVEPEEARKRAQLLKEQLAGEHNAGAIATINGPDINVSEFKITNRDMDFAELDRAASQSIYLRYGVPLPLVSNDASTYNNVETAVIIFYERTVLPLYDKLMSGISKMLLPRYGVDAAQARLTYNQDNIKPLQQKMLENLKLRKDMGIETINELRETLPNRDEVEGGDVIYQNANLLPIGTDLMQENVETDEEKRAYL